MLGGDGTIIGEVDVVMVGKMWSWLSVVVILAVLCGDGKRSNDVVGTVVARRV